MKISKLLVLTALWLGMGASAMAEVPESTWTIPEPQGLVFTTFSADYDDETGEPMRFYLYNPAAKMFFASGNSWNTQASLRTFGYPFWVTESSEADAPDGSYELWDDFSNADRADVNGPHNLFTDDGGSTWVDHADQGNYSWTFEIVGDYVRFQNVALIEDLPETYAGTYIGWTGDYKGDKNSSVLRMIAPDTEGTCIDWKAVTVDSYQAFVESDAYKAYTDGVDCFFLAQQLREVLVEGDEIGAAIADQLAVFINTASTKEEMSAALTAAKAAVEKRKQELIDGGYDNATVENPVDVTAKFLTNYDFKGDDLKTGWSGTEFGSYGPKENAEHYNKTYDSYQKVNGGMKAGVYAVGVKAFYRAGNAQPAWDNFKAQNAQSKYAKLYAKVGSIDRESAIVSPCVAMLTEYSGTGGTSTCTYTDEETGEETTYIIPNNMEAAEYYMHTLGLYDNKVLIAINTENDTLTLGVRKSAGVDGDWSIFDDFSLTYYGKGTDACQLYVNEAMKNFSEYIIEEGTLYTEAYLTAYQTAYQGEKTASSMAEVDAIIGGINDAKTALDNNIALWKKYQKTIEKGDEMRKISDYVGMEETDFLSDYLDFEYEDIIKDVKLTNEELTAEIEKLEGWMATMEENSKKDVYDGKDMTKYIKNPGFDEDEDINSGGAEGWTIDKGTGTNITRGPLGQGNQDLMISALGEGNFCFEAWHRYNWDVWQEVENLPVGMYELQVQGYVRCEMPGYNSGDELEGEYTSPVYLYMNNAMSSFPSVFSEQVADKHYVDGALPVVESHSWNGAIANYPNSMGAASLCFMWGMYKTTAYGLIAKEGEKFRIGVKMLGNTDWWCIWDNFKLIYRTPSADLVKPILEEELAKIDLSKPMGKNVFAQAEAVTKAAQEAIANNDGAAMFAALTDAYDLSAAIIASTALFDDLSKANEALYEAISSSDNEGAIDEANNLFNTIANGIEKHEYDDADVEGLMNQIAAARAKLGFPNDWENASDDNPKDFTGVIVNPAYDEGIDGWSGTAAAYGSGYANAEIFGKDFDYYQDIEGLPAGTYQVTVQGFYRAGGAEDDYKAYKENAELLNHAFIYAMTSLNGDTAIASKPMKRLAAEAASEIDLGYVPDGYVYAAKETEEGLGDGWLVPNTMDAAGEAFSEEKYLNEGVTFKLTEGAKLRIGLKKNVNIDNNWTIFDNWQLTYFGKNSGKTADGDASGINTINESVQVKIEYFTLDGRKATRAQKGIMIQKMTLGNGATIVRKVQK